MRSLRGVLLLETILASAAIVVTGGLVLYFLVRGVLVEQFDQSLRDNLLPIAGAIEQEPEGVDLAQRRIDLGELTHPEHPGCLRIWVEGGGDIYRSPSLGTGNLEPIAGTLESPGFRWLTLPGGRPGRAIGMTFTPPEDGVKKLKQEALAAGRPWTPLSRRVGIVLARDTAAISTPLRRMGLLLGSVCLGTLALSAAFLGWTIHRSLRPLHRLAGEIARLDETLSARLQATDAPAEVQPVVARMNELLQRLEAAFQRERTLGANVAHELRTPLAGIRSTIEVALLRPRSAAEQERTLQQSLAIVLDMQVMVENLLLLARVESGKARGDTRPVLLRERLLGSWQPLEAVALRRGLRVDWALEDAAQVTTDPTLLDVVLRNVLENAVEHANEGGTVRIEAVRQNGGARVRVGNTGCGLRREDVHRVFDRFWRGGAARSEAGLHCGPGLVIVKEILEALGGSAEASSSREGWFEIALSIPGLAETADGEAVARAC